MTRDRAVMIVALLIALGALTGAGALLKPINAQREELKLVVTPDVAQNMPPEIAFTQAALGSFRGLAVDYLWTRATQLQDEGKYYEAVQLSEWITTLQPRFAQVWAFQAWNMSYNISAAVRTPEEKWQWVTAGADLLRERGIPLNPEETRLYRELAYIYLHKIGKYSVDTHWHYKVELAKEWHMLLGPPPGGASAEAIEAFRRVAESPASLEALYAAHPSAAAHAARLKELGMALDESFLRDYSMAEAMYRWGLRPGVAEGDAAVARQAALVAWLERKDLAESREALVNYVRRRVLVERLRMEPDFMLELMKRYGPIDWRHPAAHALYWAELGHVRTAGRPKQDKFEVLQLDRVLLHGLQGLAYSGHITYDPLTDYYNQTPEPRLFGAYETALAAALERRELLGESSFHLENPHRGFLEIATHMAYVYGSRSMAQGFYDKLIERYGAQYPDTYGRPLDEFVFFLIVRGMKDIETARPTIMGLIQTGMLQGLGEGRGRVASQMIRQAKRVHDYYSRIKTNREANLRLPPFERMVADAASDLMGRPAAGVPPLIKSRIWRNLPMEMRRGIYDRVSALLNRQSLEFGFDANMLFPEPEGMEAYRKEQQAQGADENSETDSRPQLK